MQNACVFDLDGTLINSLRDLAESTNYALGKQGYPLHKTEEYRYLVGRGVPQLIVDALPAGCRAPEILKKTRGLFDAHYGAHYLDHTAPYESIPQLLSELKKRGFRLAVVSNKPDGFVNEIVGRLFPETFDAVIGQREGVPRKPDPASVFDACGRMRAEAKNGVYLGDSGVDMLTATAAGMFAVGVLWGFRSRGELLENGAQKLIAQPLELLPLIDARQA